MKRAERIILEADDYKNAVKVMDKSCLCKIIRIQPKVNCNVLKLKAQKSGWIVK